MTPEIAAAGTIIALRLATEIWLEVVEEMYVSDVAKRSGATSARSYAGAERPRA